MKRTLIATVLFAVLILMAVPVSAGTDIKVDAQVRARSQMSDMSFDTTGAMNCFRELRTRVGLSGTVNDNAHVYIQFQDSRIAGDDPGTSGGLTGGNNVDLHQGYIKIDNIFGKGWGGMAGRFEFAKGNQRFFGTVGWHQVGRAWDGGALWYKNEDFDVTAFSFKTLELQNQEFNKDTDVFGLYGTLNKFNLDLFALYEVNADTIGYDGDIKPLSRINLGMYYHRQYNQFDFEMNGAYQMGTKGYGTPTIDEFGEITDTIKSEMDIAAFMFAFEGGYTLEGDLNARVALGVDYSSGDDGSDTTEYKAFTNAYYTGHKFRGYMDYFLGSNQAGLMDIMFRAKLDPIPGWTLKGDFHYFTTAQDYYSALDDTTLTKNVGMEFDFSVSTTRIAGVNFVAGTSLFLPSEDFAGMVDPEIGFWTYTQAIVTIK